MDRIISCIIVPRFGDLIIESSTVCTVCFKRGFVAKTGTGANTLLFNRYYTGI